MLRSRLYEAELERREAKVDALNATKIGYRLGPPDPLVCACSRISW